MKPHLAPLRYCAIPLLLTAALGFAQQSNTPSVKTDDETLTLSPFVVSSSKDTGYIAADTLNAGRLATNLLMTPGSIDIFTRDLINDLGVFNIDEASAWLTNGRAIELGAIETNSMNPGSLAQQDSGTNISLRGLGANPSTRNYFTSSQTPKEYNVERVESSRGPNAILYGEGGPGGSVNYNTKRAQNRNFNTLRLRTDNLWSKIMTLDVNRKLTDNLDMRYNLGLVDRNHYLDRTKFKEIGNAANFVYRPFARTSITVDVDVARTVRPSLIMPHGEQFAKWDNQPIVGKPAFTIAQQTAKGILLWTGVKKLTWMPDVGLVDLTGYARTAGYGLPENTTQSYDDTLFPSAAPGVPGISKAPALKQSFNANPKDIDVTDRAQDYQVSFDHTFLNDISFQVAGQFSDFSTIGGNYNFTTIYIDPLATLPSGAANPHYGKQYAQAHVGRTIDYSRTSKTVRAVASYPVKHWGGTTNVSAFATYQKKTDTTIYTDLHIKEPAGSTVSITDARSLIWVNRYFDDLTDDMPDFRSMYDTVDVPVVDLRTNQTLKAAQAALTGNYFENTLSVVAGFRRDSSERLSETGVAATRDPVTGAYTQYTPDTLKALNNTKVFGFVYFPLKWVGVYANHGEGFTIATDANMKIDGTFSKGNIVPSKEKSFGLRFNLGGTSQIKIVGSVGYYAAEQENNILAVGVGAINTLWRDLGLFEGKDYSGNYINTFSTDKFISGGLNNISSTRSTEGYGYEASFTANVGNSFRLTINGALPKTKLSNAAPDYLAYVNQYRATWEAFANNPANPTRGTNLTNIAQIQQAIDGFTEGRALDRTYTYRYNVFGIYTLRSTVLKNFRVGGGAQFFGKSLIGNPTNQPYNYIYDKPYYLVGAQLGYPFKFGKFRADVQLNIDNILGHDRNIFSGVFPHVLNGATIMVPYGRKEAIQQGARLTVTIPF